MCFQKQKIEIWNFQKSICLGQLTFQIIYILNLEINIKFCPAAIIQLLGLFQHYLIFISIREIFDAYIFLIKTWKLIYITLIIKVFQNLLLYIFFIFTFYTNIQYLFLLHCISLQLRCSRIHYSFCNCIQFNGFF